MYGGGKFSDGVDKKGHGYERVIKGYPATAAGMRRNPDTDRAQISTSYQSHIHEGIY